jgi:uncharacterized protein YbjT (DUF2867 family)
MEEKVLVAGATGYLGRHLVSALKARGYRVRALVRRGKQVDGADEHVEAEVTRPETLLGVCDGVDAVFSALGITRQKDPVDFEDIDYAANAALLDEAVGAGARRFGVIAPVGHELCRDLKIVQAKERFIEELGAAPIEGVVVRATGFFKDVAEIFKMARRGRVYLFGDGEARTNAVHGADLAGACVRALFSGQQEIAVGGPVVETWDEIAHLAFHALGRRPKITRVPEGVARAALAAVRPFNRRAYDVGAFLVRVSTHEILAPMYGTHTVASFFDGLAAGAEPA